MNENMTNTNSQEAINEPAPMNLDVRVRPIAPKNNLLAFASVKINDCFAVDGLKVMSGEKGLFVNMPSAPDGKGGYKDVCFPITSDFRKQLQAAVLDGYSVGLKKCRQRLTVQTVSREKKHRKSPLSVHGLMKPPRKQGHSLLHKKPQKKQEMPDNA